MASRSCGVAAGRKAAPRRTGHGRRCCERPAPTRPRSPRSRATSPGCSGSFRSCPKSPPCSRRPSSGATSPPGQFALFDAVAALLQESVVDRPTVLMSRRPARGGPRLACACCTSSPATCRTAGCSSSVRTAATTPPAPAPTRCSTKLAREGRVLPLRGLTESQVGHAGRAASPVNRPAPTWSAPCTGRRNGNPLYVDSITHLLVAEERLHPLAATAARTGRFDTAVAAEHARRHPFAPRLPRRRVTRPAARRRRHRAHVHAAGARHRGRSRAGRAARPPRRCRQPRDDPHERQRSPARSCSSTSSCATRCTASSNRAGGRSCTGASARALEEVHRGDLDPHLAELAHHFLLAIGPGRDASRAIDYSARAGDRAMAQTAYDEAAAHYRRALDTLRVDRAAATRSAVAICSSPSARRAHAAATRPAGRAPTSRRRRWPASSGLGDRLAAAAIGYAGSPATTSVAAATRRSSPSSRRRSPPCRRAIRRCACACWRRLSVALYWSDLDGRRFELSEEAVAMARRLRDPATLALAIHSRRYAQWGPDNFEQRLADAAQCRTLAFEANELELAVSASRWRFTDLLEDGDVAAADRELDSHAELASACISRSCSPYTTQFRALRAIMQGRFRRRRGARRRRPHAGPARRQPAGRHRLRVADAARVVAASASTTELDAFLRTALRSAPPHAATTSVMALIHAELGERGDGCGDGRAARRAGAPEVAPRHAVPARPRPPDARVRPRSAMTTHAEEIYDLMRPYRRPRRHRRCARPGVLGAGRPLSRRARRSQWPPRVGDRPLRSRPRHRRPARRPGAARRDALSSSAVAARQRTGRSPRSGADAARLRPDAPPPRSACSG